MLKKYDFLFFLIFFFTHRQFLRVSHQNLQFCQQETFCLQHISWGAGWHRDCHYHILHVLRSKTYFLNKWQSSPAVIECNLIKWRDQRREIHASKKKKKKNWDGWFSKKSAFNLNMKDLAEHFYIRKLKMLSNFWNSPINFGSNNQ